MKRLTPLSHIERHLFTTRAERRGAAGLRVVVCVLAAAFIGYMLAQGA